MVLRFGSSARICATPALTRSIMPVTTAFSFFNYCLNHRGLWILIDCACDIVGQALLAKRLGKTRIIAETGAGQHGASLTCIANEWPNILAH